MSAEAAGPAGQGLRGPIPGPRGRGAPETSVPGLCFVLRALGLPPHAGPPRGSGLWEGGGRGLAPKLRWERMSVSGPLPSGWRSPRWLPWGAEDLGGGRRLPDAPISSSPRPCIPTS